MSDRATLEQRLAHADAGVRRLAVHDLARMAAADPQATDALLAHLPRETDERAAMLIIGHLAAARHAPAMPCLKALYDDRRTPARPAHAAILAHDAIELASRADAR